MKYRYENYRYIVDFESTEEALRFVMEWQFGYGGSSKARNNITFYKKWSLPRPSSAPNHMDLDQAIQDGLERLLGS